MARQGARSDAEALAQFWTDWAASNEQLMFRVAEVVCQQEKLVRQVLARCPPMDDTKGREASGGAAARPWPLGAQAGAAGAAAPRFAWTSDAQAAEDARQPTDESREKASGRKTRTSTISKGGQSKASHQQGTDTPEKQWEAIDEWQSRYDESTGDFMRQQRAVSGSVANILPARAVQRMNWWLQLEEPPRQGLLYNLASNRWFNYAIGILILMNTAFAVYVTDFGMSNVGQSAPNETAVEVAFLLCFAFELFLKILVHRAYFFCNDEMMWSIFDFSLVLISFIDIGATLAATSSGGGAANMSFARVLRIFKVGRILRMLRAVKFLRKIRVILTSIIQSFSTFVWSVSVMVLICFIFSLLFVQQISGFTSDMIQAGSLDDELWAAQQKQFGSVGSGTITLFRVAMGGTGWDTVQDLIVPLGWLCSAAFLFFIVFFTFALMSILAGMFLSTVMQQNTPDNEETILEDWQIEADDFAEIIRIVEPMDVLHTGTITKEVFVKYCNFHSIQLCFAKVGIDVAHPGHFFLAAADGAESVGVQEFAEGAIRMKGSATNIDIQRLVFEVRSVTSDKSGEVCSKGISGSPEAPLCLSPAHEA